MNRTITRILSLCMHRVLKTRCVINGACKKHTLHYSQSVSMSIPMHHNLQ